MQQTISPTRRSKKRTSRAGLTALWFLVGVWGCASGPELVYVDLTAVEPLSVNAAQSVASTHESQMIDSSASIASLEERSVFIGSAQDKASDALKLYLQTQEEAAEAVLEGLREAYLAEIESVQRDGREQILDEYRTWLDEAFDELHAEFVDHAKKTGSLRFDLAWRVGFPDPDPGSLVSSNDPLNRRSLSKAKEIRDSLRALGVSFWSVVAERLNRLEQERETKLSAFSAEMDEQRAAAIEKAQRDADAVTEQAFAILERSALDPEAQLPAVSSVESAVNSKSAPRRTWQTTDPPSESIEDVRAQLAVFLKVHGFQLADDLGSGRDVTQEFIVWRRIYQAGR